MHKLWSAIATFNFLFTVNLWLMDRTNESPIDVFNPAQNWSSVPIFALSFGTVLTLFSALLMQKLIHLKRALVGVDRLPSLWIEKFEHEEFKKKWKLTVFFLTVIFPLFAQIHFWRRFHEWDAWTNDPATLVESVSLYKYVSPIYFFDWDAFRYGDYSKMALDGWKGVSFVPFWQPFIMAVLTSLCFFVCMQILIQVFSRKTVNKE